jgi:hypothetical protein
MYVTIVPNRGSLPAILLRETYRDGGKVKNRTLANLTKWKPEKIAALRAVLRDETLLPAGEGFEIVRSLPHGHIAAALGTARRLGLDPRVKGAALMPPGVPRTRLLALALIVARLIDPAAKLATARGLDAASAGHSLGSVLGLGTVAVNELYAALDWLLAQQGKIEAKLARRHLADGTLVLYDVTSTYLEGRCCPLARFGYSRDGKPHKRQIVFGVLCTPQGCPIAVEVFAGNTADPSTLTVQIDKLRQRFGLRRVVLVGDRGMITQARITQELEPAGLDWITALRAADIQALATDDGPLQISLFDQRDLAEITSPDYPGERLIVCRNPALAAERGRKRGELLEATELALRAIQTRVRRKRRPLKGAAAIGEAPRLRGGRLWRRAQPQENGQALHPHDYRAGFHLRAQSRHDRGRSQARRDLCAAHPGAAGRARCRSHGALLQSPRDRRTRLPQLQDRRYRGAAGLPLERGPRPRPRFPVPARLPPRMASAPGVGSRPVRRP